MAKAAFVYWLDERVAVLDIDVHDELFVYQERQVEEEGDMSSPQKRRLS